MNYTKIIFLSLAWALGIGPFIALKNIKKIIKPTRRLSTAGKFYNNNCYNGANLNPPAGIVLKPHAERIFWIFIQPNAKLTYFYKINVLKLKVKFKLI